MDVKTWNETLEKVNQMDEEEFNELLRFALSERASREDERLDWSTGFPVTQPVGSTTYTVEQ